MSRRSSYLGGNTIFYVPVPTSTGRKPRNIDTEVENAQQVGRDQFEKLQVLISKPRPAIQKNIVERSENNEPDQIEGQKVINWMREVGVEQCRPILVGVKIDDGKEDNLLIIEAIELQYVLICSINGQKRRIPPGKIRDCYFYDYRPGDILSKIIFDALSEGERHLETCRKELRKAGFPVDKFPGFGDVTDALSMVKDFKNNILPSLSDQNKRYVILKRSELFIYAIDLISQWISLRLSQSPIIDADLLIKLALCFRRSGQFQKALDATDVVIMKHPRVIPTRSQRAILATERAATLLDVFEQNFDRSLLVEARECAGIAYSIEQSDEIKSLYNRLRALER